MHVSAAVSGIPKLLTATADVPEAVPLSAAEVTFALVMSTIKMLVFEPTTKALVTLNTPLPLVVPVTVT